MNLKVDPFPLIFAQGDEATQLACLEFFGLKDSPLAKDCLLKLNQQQRADGAFPSRLDPQQWGTRETVRNALLLLKVGLVADVVNVNSAVQFILHRQNPDGGWSENRALTIPPEVMALSTEHSVTWITADIVELLRQVGMEARAEYRAALEWLRGMQNQYGGWVSYSGAIGDRPDHPGDPDSSAQITFLMGKIYGEQDPVYLEGRALFEKNLDECAQDVSRGYRIRARDGQREPPEVYHLTHLLLSWVLDPPRRFESGYDASDPRVRRLMETLVDVQSDDGGWRPFWAGESSPVYTVLAIKVLILSGMLVREDLQAGVEAYAA